MIKKDYPDIPDKLMERLLQMPPEIPDERRGYFYEHECAEAEKEYNGIIVKYLTDEKEPTALKPYRRPWERFHRSPPKRHSAEISDCILPKKRFPQKYFDPSESNFVSDESGSFFKKTSIGYPDAKRSKDSDNAYTPLPQENEKTMQTDKQAFKLSGRARQILDKKLTLVGFQEELSNVELLLANACSMKELRLRLFERFSCDDAQLIFLAARAACKDYAVIPLTSLDRNNEYDLLPERLRKICQSALAALKKGDISGSGTTKIILLFFSSQSVMEFDEELSKKIPRWDNLYSYLTDSFKDFFAMYEY